MNNWSNLTTLLFGAGFALIVLSLVAMLIRVASDKRMYSGGMRFMTTIVILLFLCGGASVLYKDKIPEDIRSLKVGAKPADNNIAIASGSVNSSISQADSNSANESNAASSTYTVQPNTDQSSAEITAKDLIGGWNATDDGGSPTNKNNFLILYIPDSSQLYLRNYDTDENIDYTAKNPHPVDYYDHYNYQINTSGLGVFNFTMSLVDNGSGGEYEIRFINKNKIKYTAFDGHDYTLIRISESKAKSVLGIGSK